jgi:hypothetical protein
MFGAAHKGCRMSAREAFRELMAHRKRKRLPVSAKHAAAWTDRTGPREVFSHERPHPCERLARMEGQTNFWLAFGGSEAGTDTTMDAAALAFAERRSGIPAAVMLAYWGGSTSARYALATCVLQAMIGAGAKFGESERGARRAVLDALDVFGGRDIGPLAERAKRHRMRHEDYSALLKLATGILHAWLGEIQPEWVVTRFSW